MIRRALPVASTLLFLGFAACAGAGAGRPDDVDPRPVRPGGRVVREGNFITITFPALPLAETGCARAEERTRTRRFYWLATIQKPNVDGSNDFFQTGVNLYLPDTTAVTAATLDRALRSQALTVDHAKGEPPMPMRRWVPERASARLEHGRVVIRVSGEEAVGAFLAFGVRTVGLQWCERGETLTGAEVPVLTRP